MNAVTALFRANIRVCRTRRLMFLLWFFYLLLGLIVVAPVPIFLGRSAVSSLWADQLVKEFDAQWMAEASRYFHSQPMVGFGLTLGMTLLLAALASVFFAGGALRLYTAEETRYRNADFFHDCSFYFWRFLRLMLCAVLFYLVVLAFNGILGKIAGKLWGEGMRAAPLVNFGRVRMVVVALLLVYVNAAMDFARVYIVSENRRSAVGAAFWALRFTARHYLRILILFVIAASLVVGLFALYRAGEEWLPRTMGGALLLALVAQIVSLLRIRLRLTVWAAEAELYASLQPPYRPPEEFALVGAYASPAPPDLQATAQAELPPPDEPA